MIDDFKGQTIRPFPIIVDEIFNFDYANKHNLDFGLMEEMVSSISYRTYIFLDSLSTAYELGMFRNSKSKNNIVLLLEEDYKQRTQRTVGEYLLKSLEESSSILTYRSSEYIADKEVYEFLFGLCPDNIKDCVQKEMREYSRSLETIMFVSGEEAPDDKNNYIVVENNDSKIITTFSLKSLFYFMSYYLKNKHSSIKTLKEFATNLEEENFLRDFREMVKKCSVSFLKKNEELYFIHDNPVIVINGYQTNDEEVNKIIRHTYYFFVLLNELNSKKKLSRVTDIEDYVKSPKDSNGFSFDDEFENKSLFKMVSSYIANPDLYVETIKYKINKKYRTIRKYKDNYKGKQLRAFHEYLLTLLERMLPTNKLSFAYKKDNNTIKCLNSHINNKHFIKSDIHHYFESIRYSRFCKLMKEQMIKNLNSNSIVTYPYLQSIKNMFYIIRVLFYKGKIPLGFITSPKVSDFYLKEVDDKVELIKDITYTRYADDVLFSSNTNMKDCELVFDEYKQNLKSLNLKINEDKTIKKSFEKDGDSIKFLGINIVSKDKTNKLTISKAYLLETSKMCFGIEPNNLINDDKLLGRIRYIKYVSKESYYKLLKMISIRCGSDIIVAIRSAVE